MFKWIGFFLGMMKGFGGAVIGLLIGWWLDNNLKHLLAIAGISRPGMGFFGTSKQAQTIFHRSLFSALGHVAKADGVVTSNEINVAEELMSQLLLNAEQREYAKQAFRNGKDASFPLEAELTTFRELTNRLPHLRQLFMEILLNGALADGMLTAAERLVLERITRALGLPISYLDELLRRRYQQPGGAYRYYEDQRSYQGQQGQQRRPQTAPGTNPYAVLGLSSTANDAEVKRAYRKLMSQYHPDKMSGRDVPATMRDYAQKKVREVRAAYDDIKAQRGLK